MMMKKKPGLGGKGMRKLRFQNICHLQIISMSMKNVPFHCRDTYAGGCEELVLCSEPE